MATAPRRSATGAKALPAPLVLGSVVAVAAADEDEDLLAEAEAV